MVSVLGPEEAQAVYDVREALECQALRLFGARASAAQRERLAATVAALRAAHEHGDAIAMLEAKRAFYDALYAGAASPLLGQQATIVQNRLWHLRAQSLSQPGRAAASLAEIEETVTALCRGDADAASVHWRTHLGNAAGAAFAAWGATELPETSGAMTGPGGADPARLRLCGELRTLDLGGVRITYVPDGTGRLIPDVFLPTIDWPQHPDHLDTEGLVVASLGGFLVQTPSATTLIDTGYGPTEPATGPAMTARGLATFGGGELVRNLQRLGVRREDVDVVALTHLHFDHVGWLVDTDGAPVFSNARHVTSATEWRSASAAGDPHGHLTAEGFFQPLSALIETFEGAVDVADAVQALPTPGHTAGHTAYVVRGTARRVVVLGDAAHSPSSWNSRSTGAAGTRTRGLPNAPGDCSPTAASTRTSSLPVGTSPTSSSAGLRPATARSGGCRWTGETRPSSVGRALLQRGAGRVADVVAPQLAAPLGVPRDDPGHDALDLNHARLRPARPGEGATAQPSQPTAQQLGLRLQHLVVGTAVQDVVEVVLPGEHRSHVAGGVRLPQGLCRGDELRQLVFGGPLNEQPDGQPLERLTHLVKAAGLPVADRRHRGAAVRDDGDEALGL